MDSRTKVLAVSALAIVFCLALVPVTESDAVPDIPEYDYEWIVGESLGTNGQIILVGTDVPEEQLTSIPGVTIEKVTSGGSSYYVAKGTPSEEGIWEITGKSADGQDISVSICAYEEMNGIEWTVNVPIEEEEGQMVFLGTDIPEEQLTSIPGVTIEAAEMEGYPIYVAKGTPTKVGTYMLTGTGIDGEEVVMPVMVYGTVQFQAGEGGNVDIAEIGVPMEEYVCSVKATALQTHEFDGWYVGDTKVSSETTFKGTVGEYAGKTVVAKFLLKHTCTVAFNLQGGASGPEDMTFTSTSTEDHQFTIPDTVPARTGYEFLGWGEAADTATYHAGDTVSVGCDATKTLYAVWVQLFTITFNSAGGSPVEPITIKAGQTVRAPEIPVLEGSVFIDWLDADGEPYDWNAPITESFTLHASWQKVLYRITFDVKGGSLVESQDVEEGSKAVKPTDPRKGGYIFSGWYTDDGKAYDWNAPVTSSFTLNAEWRLDGSYKVTFETNGGSRMDPIMAVDGKATEPAAPTRDGYTFDGWYSDEDLKEKFDWKTALTGDVMLYAKWTEDASPLEFMKEHPIMTVGIIALVVAILCCLYAPDRKYVPLILGILLIAGFDAFGLFSGVYDFFGVDL